MEMEVRTNMNKKNEYTDNEMRMNTGVEKRKWKWMVYSEQWKMKVKVSCGKWKSVKLEMDNNDSEQ